MDDAVLRPGADRDDRGGARHLEVVGESPGRLADQGWRIQAYMLDEGTYDFEIDAVEGTQAVGYVFRLRVSAGPFAGHRILVKEAAPIAGLREATASAKPTKLRGTIMRVRGRGMRLTHAELL